MEKFRCIRQSGMTGRIGLVLVFIAITGLLKAQDNDPVRGYIQANQRGLAKALLIKQQAAKTNTANQTYLLSRMYMDDGKYDSAAGVLNTLNQAVEEQRLLRVLGLSIIDLHDSKKDEVIQKMIREERAIRQSKSPLVKLEAGFVLAQIDKKDDASELIEQACAMKTDSPETYVAAGDIYVSLSRILKDNAMYGKACGRYEQALLVNPKYLPALTALSRAYIGSRNFFDAKQKLSTALEVDSTWKPALQLMGELQYDLGNYKLASKYYTKFINSVTPRNSELQKYSYILYFNQEHEKAQQIIRKLLINDPDNRVLLRLLAYTSCELKQPEGLASMEKFMMIGKKDSLKILASDHEYYGRLLAMNAKDSLAVEQYKLAVTLDTAKATTWEYMAKSYEKMKKYPEAVKAYESMTIIDKDPASTIWFAMGRNCLLWADMPDVKADSVNRASVLQKAVDAFTKVTEASPNSHLGFFWRGRSLAALDPETIQGLAEASYLKAIEILELKNQNEKYKAELLEAYSYMGYLYYLKFEPASKTELQLAQEYKTTSLGYWNKILALDGSNAAALQAVKALK